MKLYRILLIFSLMLAAPVTGICQADNDLRLAKALENSGRYEEALALYNRMYESGSRNLQVIQGMKDCLTGLRQYGRLIAFYEDLLQASPYQFNYRVELGKAYYLNGDEEKAFENFRRVYTEFPENPTAYRLTAMAYIDFRLFDQAIRVYQRAIEKMDNQEILYRDIANLYRAQLDYENAVTNLLLYYKHFNRHSSYVKSQMIAMSRDDEAVQKIINAIHEFTREEFTDDTIREFLATMYIKNKEYARAFEIYHSLQEKQKNPNALVSYARLVENNNVYEYAVLAYESLIENFKSDQRIYQYKLDLARNRFYLAMQQVNANYIQKAEENIRKSIEILDELANLNQPMFRIRSLELKGDIYNEYYQDLDQAIYIYGQIVKEHKRTDIADHVRIKLGHAYLIKNDMQKAREAFEGIRGKKYKHLKTFKLAELDYFEGRFTRAKNKYQTLISEISPNDSLVNNILDRSMILSQFSADSAALADYVKAELLAERRKKSEAAEKFIEIFREQNKLSFRSGLSAGRLYMNLGKYDESKIILNEMIENYSEHDGNDEVYFLLAECSYLQRDLKNGLDYYRQILLKYPNSFYTEQARDKARLISGLLEENDGQ